jgi:hydrogenase/urease accessory protein HupE
MKKILTTTAILAASTTAAMAHPGDHAMSAFYSVVHVLTEPDHLAMIAVAFVVGGALLYKRLRRAA